METLQTLQKRINTTGKLQSIVKSMKTLSAVNIRQYEKAVISLDNYQQTILMGLQVCLRHYSLPSPSKNATPADRIIVVFGSDQGLCGRFNEKLAHFILTTIKDWKAKVHMIAIGARLYARLESSGLKAKEQFWVPSSVGGINYNVFQILLSLEKLQTKKRISHIDLFFNEHVQGTAGTPVWQPLTPLDRGKLGDMAKEPWNGPSVPQFSIAVEHLFSSLIRQYFFVSLFRAQAQSLSSEQASRLRSLQNAEKNIEEHLAELHNHFSAQRQATITSEMLDLVTGFKTSSRKKKAEQAI